MGLDMYLEARRYLSPYNEELAPVRKAVADAIGYQQKAEKWTDDRGLYQVNGVSLFVGYWRKCYPIHQWFVQNVQEGHDDCRPAFVPESTLKALEEQLDQVDDDPESASEFFVLDEGETLGGGDVDYAIRIIHHARQLQQQGWDIYYRSSW